MIVMGIDPGSHTTGYGIVKKDGRRIVHIDNGGIHTKRGDSLAFRLGEIHRQMTLLIEQHHPHVIVLEKVFVAHNVKSAMTLGHARGVLMLTAVKAGVDVMEYSPTQVKQALTGHGAATKHQIQQMTKTLLALPEIAHEDAADALAVALCYCHSHGLTTSIARSLER